MFFFQHLSRFEHCESTLYRNDNVHVVVALYGHKNLCLMTDVPKIPRQQSERSTLNGHQNDQNRKFWKIQTSILDVFDKDWLHW